MLESEAKWFGAHMGRMPALELFPMINIGSSTEHFRHAEQPWIYEYLFKPLEGRPVVHVDLKAAPGVDLVGDITDPSFQEELRARRPKSVMLLNVLEHVTDRAKIAQMAYSLVPDGGYLFVSCPYGFPYHADPMDTMFRPSPRDLAELFPGADVVSADVVAGETYYQRLVRDGWRSLKIPVRLLMPFYKPKSWWQRAVYVPWLFKRFSATCLVLKKAGGRVESA